MHLFDRDISLIAQEPLRFAGTITDNWSVNGNPDGGYIMAMLGNAIFRRAKRKNLSSSRPISSLVPFGERHGLPLKKSVRRDNLSVGRRDCSRMAKKRFEHSGHAPMMKSRVKTVMKNGRQPLPP